MSQPFPIFSYKTWRTVYNKKKTLARLLNLRAGSVFVHIKRVSIGLTVSRQKRFFFTVNCQKCRVILTVKTFLEVFQISPFQLIFMDFWLLKHLLTGESTSHVLKTLSLDITKPYNFLISLVKYYEILYLKG